MALFLASVLVVGLTMFLLGAGSGRGHADGQGASKRVSEAGHVITRLGADEIKTLAGELTPEQRRVLLDKGTEAAFCGTLLDNKLEGTYVCRLCGLPLFASESKFTSGTGWPSFFQPVDKDHITTVRDTSYGMVRDEIVCTRCSGHLGHVFEDGPKPTGLRYCLNSESLEFFDASAEMPARSRPCETETAYFAGGCFWGIEDRFQQVEGVLDAVSGYQGGRVDKPTYRQVCSGESGHAESVRVVFDPAVVTYGQLLERFFRFHDPTQLNRQGPDVGTQYRSAIYAADDAQLEAARLFVEAQREIDRYEGREVVTEVVMADYFYEAEEYHQDYHERHGGSCAIPTE